MGLVQPSSAVLYDYYSPGEHLGCFGKQNCGGWGGRRVCPLIWDTTEWGRPGHQEALMSCRLSLDHKCSVFYAAPTKSQLLATLCSGDVCQCAEGERRPRSGAKGIGWEGELVSCDTFLQGSALDC